MPTQRAIDLTRCSTKQIAWLARVAEKTASTKLREAQLQPIAEDGRTTYWDPRDALPVLLGVAEGLNPAQERARLDHVRAELVELDLARAREGVVPSGDTAHAVVALEALIAHRVAAIAPAAALEIAPNGGAQAKVRTILARHLGEACEDLAQAARRARRELQRTS